MLAGALLSVQARINGAFAVRLGSAVVTALVTFVLAALVAVAAVAVRPRSRAALRRRPADPVLWWYWLGGVVGAAAVVVAATAVPLIGVALLGVCTVAGQATGSLVVDAAGLGPGGRRPLTGARVTGAVLAIAALGLSSVGAAHAQVRPLLFVVIALTGAGLALQQAVNGQLQRVLGEARVAAMASFLVGTALLSAVVLGLSVAGRLSSLHWPPPSYLWLGGLGGAFFIIVTAAVVRTLGVLRISLAAVAGQLLGAVLLDALVPAPGHRLTPMTVLGTAVTFAAVAVSGSTRRGRS
ncbi:MAG: hypothetical protein NVSMB13_12670 [Mycobacteriales bacterium]